MSDWEQKYAIKEIVEFFCTSTSPLKFEKHVGKIIDTDRYYNYTIKDHWGIFYLVPQTNIIGYVNPQPSPKPMNDPVFTPIPILFAEPYSAKNCECGSDSVGGGLHSSWCPKAND